ncbi:MAG: TIGR03435 family protein [Vicinamibacterales bacterium]
MVSAKGGTALVLVAATLCHGSAQERDSEQPRRAATFAVTSVKPTDGSGPRTFRWGPDGSYRATNLPLVILVADALQVRTDQLIDVPSWVTTQTYDIEAKPAAPVPPAQHRGLLRALLEDRFKLRLATVARNVPVYALGLARPDRRLGRGIRPEERECVKGFAPALERPLKPGQPALCGVGVDRGVLAAGGAPISALLSALRPLLELEVVDRSGLTGRFDVYLRWTPEQHACGTCPLLLEFPASANGPSFFTAIVEQLGLRLDRQRSAKDVWRIAHIARPDSN